MGHSKLRKSVSVVVACSLLATTCVCQQPQTAEAAKKATL